MLTVYATLKTDIDNDSLPDVTLLHYTLIYILSCLLLLEGWINW